MVSIDNTGPEVSSIALPAANGHAGGSSRSCESYAPLAAGIPLIARPPTEPYARRSGHPCEPYAPARAGVAILTLPTADGHARRSRYQRRAPRRVLNDLDTRIERIDGILKILDGRSRARSVADNFDERPDGW